MGFNLDHAEISGVVAWAQENKNNRALIARTLEKAAECKGLDHREASLLLAGASDDELFSLAGKIKKRFYGSRVVLFAPLYLSNHCVNACSYCPFNAKNTRIPRKKLSQEEIKEQIVALLKMGHKRVVIEAGEHPTETPIDYIIESIKTIYSVRHENGAIRRINVNIGATTVEEYKKLAAAKIGTYTLFQETYDRARYEEAHQGGGRKSDYEFQLAAMDRAMQGGIDDVGMGVLFGLSDYRFELAALLSHAEYLEKTYGVGPHTISVPRIRKAEGVAEAAMGIDEETLLRIVACIRLAAPYTGIIASTRENKSTRDKMLAAGVSQISGGSRTSVGGYADENEKARQFETHDNRTLNEVVNHLMHIGHIPSFCTACYREGRTGDRFMSLCKSEQIQNCCHPNALMTLQEFLIDYADEEGKSAGERLIQQELENIPSTSTKNFTLTHLEKIKSGKRDFVL